MSVLRTTVFSFALLFMCFGFFSEKVQAGFRIPLQADFFNDATLNDNVDPLELGVCGFGNDYIIYVLPTPQNLGPLDKLDINQVPQAFQQAGDVIKNPVAPGTGTIFGSSDMCVHLNNKTVFGFRQDGNLNASVCDGAPQNVCLNNKRFSVMANPNDFSTVRTHTDPTNPNTVYITGRNDATNQIIWSLSDDGQNWTQQGTINNASGVTDGATRFAAGIQNGNYWALYSSTDPNEYEIEVVDTNTGVSIVIDTDLRGGAQKESCGKSVPGNGMVYGAYYNARDDMVRGFIFPIPLTFGSEVVVTDLGQGPPFQQGLGFFNPACAVDQNGNGVVAWLGQKKLVVVDPMTNKFIFIDTLPPWSDINSGPAVILPITDMNAVPERFWGSPFFGAFAPNEHVSFWSFISRGRSLEIVQFVVFPRIIDIPTLSEWGLIALAAILGIVGFMVYRRRKAAA